MQNDRNDMLNLDKLPIETVLDLFSYLGPENISSVAKVSKFFRDIANHDNLYNLFWNKKLERHFPHRLNTISIQNNTNGYTRFRTAYHDEYDYDGEKLPLNKRKIFSLVKECDVLSLETTLTLSDLDLVDKNGISPLAWAKKNQDKQRLLDCFYELAVNNYKDNSGLTVDPEKTDSHKRTILHWAILCHQPASTIELLILQGVNINALTDAGSNALRLSAIEGQAEIVELLITRYHADMNARSDMGATALLLAIEHGHKNVVDVLLKHNADISIPLQTDSDYHKKFNVFAGDTPLHAAIKLGRKDVVEELIEKGANINVLTGVGSNALRLSAIEGQAEIVELLITQYHADINARSDMGATPLLLAIENGHKNVVDVLLKHNADINIPLQTNSIYHKRFNVFAGDIPLHVAIKLGYKDVVEELIKKGADVNALTGAGRNALRLAAEKGQAEIAELLITQYHADINARSGMGATPLLLAIENGHKNVVDVLLKHNADINIPLQTDSDYHKIFNVVAGDTPLHAASRLGSVAIVQELLNKGANIETTNNQQETPIDVAVKEARYTNDLKLLDLSAKISRLPGDHRNAFSLFGYKFSYGCSASQIKSATDALKSVIFDGADESCLNAHEDALNSDEVKPIYQNYQSLRIIR